VSTPVCFVWRGKIRVRRGRPSEELGAPNESSLFFRNSRNPFQTAYVHPDETTASPPPLRSGEGVGRGQGEEALYFNNLAIRSQCIGPGFNKTFFASGVTSLYNVRVAFSFDTYSPRPKPRGPSPGSSPPQKQRHTPVRPESRADVCNQLKT